MLVAELALRVGMPTARQRLLALYDLFPFHEHPLWRAVQAHDLDYEQVIRAEVQHWLRTRAGQEGRREALYSSRGLSELIFNRLLQTYLEECTDDDTGPGHLELVERLILEGGLKKEELASSRPTPANAAAIALYADIGRRGAGCHMVGAGTVEHYYCTLAPKIYSAYTERYGMSGRQAETYRIHGPMDAAHAERAFDVLEEAIALHGWEAVESSVRDAFVATSLHYDGMMQAATGQLSYWDGVVR
jgi:pyrroloquinoline quinone (PQQ) biosynthesis protein C